MAQYKFKKPDTSSKIQRFNPRRDLLFERIVEGAFLRLHGNAWARINRDLEDFCNFLEREAGRRYQNLDAVSILATLHDTAFQNLPEAIKANEDFLVLTGTTIFDKDRYWPENPAKVLRDQACLSRRDYQAEVKEALLGLMIAFVRGTGHLPTIQKGVHEDISILNLPDRQTFTSFLIDLLYEFPITYRKGLSLLTLAQRVLNKHKKILSYIQRFHL